MVNHNFFHLCHLIHVGWIRYGRKSVWCYIRRWNRKMQESCLRSFVLDQQGEYSSCLHSVKVNTWQTFSLNLAFYLHYSLPFLEVHIYYNLVWSFCYALLPMMMFCSCFSTGQEDRQSCTCNCYYEPSNPKYKWVPLSPDYFATETTWTQIRHVRPISSPNNFHLMDD